MHVRTIRAATHGRYLVDLPAEGTASALIVGFHGYAEPAEAHHHRMQSMPGWERWALVTIQGLHRFYRRRTQEVIASWMTRQDRELAIADNLAYVSSVVTAAAAEAGRSAPLVITGFSQGVAMAYRAACALPHPVAAMVSLGGDVPPELTSSDLRRVPAALVGRGRGDEWYTEAKMNADLERLQGAGVAAHPVVFDGGHEWTPSFALEAAAFITRFV
jgi:predicted esterase